LKKGTPSIKWRGEVPEVSNPVRAEPAQAHTAKHKAAINVLLAMKPGLIQTGKPAKLLFGSFTT
jgi:hypothetical protein